MSDLLDKEIERRENANKQLLEGQGNSAEALKQFAELDAFHKSNEKKSRDKLELIYKENRYFSGQYPIVYSEAQVEQYPFFGGQTDDKCNPYYPITKVQDKTFDGLAPLRADITRTGDWARQRVYSPTESDVRVPAMTALQAFPDRSGETASGKCEGGNPAGATDQATCTTNGGTWLPPEYEPGATATEKLKAALEAWRPVIQGIIDSNYNNPGNTEVAYWTNIRSKIDAILPAIQNHVSYPSQTQDFFPGSAADLARDYLIANNTSIESHSQQRKSYLEGEAKTEEDLFFGVLGLRLHTANGSYAKLKAAGSIQGTTKSIIDDNIAAIAALKLLKSRSS